LEKQVLRGKAAREVKPDLQVNAVPEVITAPKGILVPLAPQELLGLRGKPDLKAPRDPKGILVLRGLLVLLEMWDPEGRRAFKESQDLGDQSVLTVRSA
jgi:hypothetical protein